MNTVAFWNDSAVRLLWTRRRGIMVVCFILLLVVLGHAQSLSDGIRYEPFGAYGALSGSAFIGIADPFTVRGSCLVVSKEALRFRFVLEQGSDDSCGFAAAATLLSLYWGIDASEGELLSFTAQSYDDGSYEISLAGLKETIARFGLASRGFSMTTAQLIEALGRYGPVIVHYDRPWPHFVVAVGYEGERFAIADPVRGFLAIDEAELSRYWSGAVLVCASADASFDASAVMDAMRFSVGKLLVMEAFASRPIDPGTVLSGRD